MLHKGPLVWGNGYCIETFMYNINKRQQLTRGQFGHSLFINSTFNKRPATHLVDMQLAVQSISTINRTINGINQSINTINQSFNA